MDCRRCVGRLMMLKMMMRLIYLSTVNSENERGMVMQSEIPRLAPYVRSVRHDVI